jgi:hypothetical protein
MNINSVEKYSVITFATNKLSYIQFAMNCAQSILLWNDINIYIVSNLAFPIPRHLSSRVFVIPAKAEHVALGIGMKMYIDEYLQTENTLFIDSDCLCFGNLNAVFKASEGMDVTVAGNIVPAESWCGTEQAKTIKKYFGLDNLIRFNGGLYYIKKSEGTDSIFKKAQEIASKYDYYGFSRINNKWINEEGPLSIAMMLNGQYPISDDGNFMTDLYTDRRPRKMNVLTGTLLMRNPPYPSPDHRPWYPDTYSPLILHFGGNNINSYPYKSQRLLLKFYHMGIPTPLATALVNILIHLPYRSFHWAIGLLRKLKTKQ